MGGYRLQNPIAELGPADVVVEVLIGDLNEMRLSLTDGCFVETSEAGL